MNRPKKQTPASQKMGRHRKAIGLRIARGVRLDPEMVRLADMFVGHPDYALPNFTSVVEAALGDWISRQPALARNKLTKGAKTT